MPEPKHPLEVGGEEEEKEQSLLEDVSEGEKEATPENPVIPVPKDEIPLNPKGTVSNPEAGEEIPDSPEEISESEIDEAVSKKGSVIGRMWRGEQVSQEEKDSASGLEKTALRTGKTVDIVASIFGARMIARLPDRLTKKIARSREIKRIVKIASKENAIRDKIYHERDPKKRKELEEELQKISPEERESTGRNNMIRARMEEIKDKLENSPYLSEEKKVALREKLAEIEERYGRSSDSIESQMSRDIEKVLNEHVGEKTKKMDLLKEAISGVGVATGAFAVRMGLLGAISLAQRWKKMEDDKSEGEHATVKEVIYDGAKDMLFTMFGEGKVKEMEGKKKAITIIGAWAKAAVPAMIATAGFSEISEKGGGAFSKAIDTAQERSGEIIDAWERVTDTGSMGDAAKALLETLNWQEAFHRMTMGGFRGDGDAPEVVESDTATEEVANVSETTTEGSAPISSEDLNSINEATEQTVPLTPDEVGSVAGVEEPVATGAGENISTPEVAIPDLENITLKEIADIKEIDVLENMKRTLQESIKEQEVTAIDTGQGVDSADLAKLAEVEHTIHQIQHEAGILPGYEGTDSAPTIEDIEKMDDPKILEILKSRIEESIDQQEAAAVGTDQGVATEDLDRLAAVEERQFELQQVATETPTETPNVEPAGPPKDGVVPPVPEEGPAGPPAPETAVPDSQPVEVTPETPMVELVAEDMTPEEIAKIDDPKVLESLKSQIKESIVEQEAAAVGTDQGVATEDLDRLAAVEEKQFELQQVATETPTETPNVEPAGPPEDGVVPPVPEEGPVGPPAPETDTETTEATAPSTEEVVPDPFAKANLDHIRNDQVRGAQAIFDRLGVPVDKQVELLDNATAESLQQTLRVMELENSFGVDSLDGQVSPEEMNKVISELSGENSADADRLLGAWEDRGLVQSDAVLAARFPIEHASLAHAGFQTEITDGEANLSLDLGQEETPDHLEQVFYRTAMENADIGDEITNVEGARILNVGANMTALSEGNNVAGVTAEDFAKYVSFENGKLEISDYEGFRENILDKLTEHSENIITADNVANTGAVAFLDNIKNATWDDMAEPEAAEVNLDQSVIDSAEQPLFKAMVEKAGERTGLGENITDINVSNEGTGTFNLSGQEVSVENGMITRMGETQFDKPLPLDSSEGHAGLMAEANRLEAVRLEEEATQKAAELAEAQKIADEATRLEKIAELTNDDRGVVLEKLGFGEGGQGEQEWEFLKDKPVDDLLDKNIEGHSGNTMDYLEGRHRGKLRDFIQLAIRNGEIANPAGESKTVGDVMQQILEGRATEQINADLHTASVLATPEAEVLDTDTPASRPENFDDDDIELDDSDPIEDVPTGAAESETPPATEKTTETSSESAEKTPDTVAARMGLQPIPKTEIPEGMTIKATPEAEAFMRENGIRVSDGSIIGEKLSHKLDFLPEKGEEITTESIRFTLTDKGDLRVNIADSDGSKDIVEVTERGKIVDIQVNDSPSTTQLEDSPGFEQTPGFHEARTEELQAAMDRLHDAGVINEQMTIEDISKIDDQKLLEKMKQALDETINKQEAVATGDQGVDRGDIMAQAAVEERLHELSLEDTPSETIPPPAENSSPTEGASVETPASPQDVKLALENLVTGILANMDNVSPEVLKSLDGVGLDDIAKLSDTSLLENMREGASDVLKVLKENPPADADPQIIASATRGYKEILTTIESRLNDLGVEKAA